MTCQSFLNGSRAVVNPFILNCLRHADRHKNYVQGLLFITANVVMTNSQSLPACNVAANIKAMEETMLASPIATLLLVMSVGIMVNSSAKDFVSKRSLKKYPISYTLMCGTT